jgi:hypothetical protein
MAPVWLVEVQRARGACQRCTRVVGVGPCRARRTMRLVYVLEAPCVALLAVHWDGPIGHPAVGALEQGARGGARRRRDADNRRLRRSKARRRSARRSLARRRRRTLRWREVGGAEDQEGDQQACHRKSMRFERYYAPCTTQHTRKAILVEETHTHIPISHLAIALRRCVTMIQAPNAAQCTHAKRE